MKTRAALDKAIDEVLGESCPAGAAFNGAGISPSFRVARAMLMLAFDAADRAKGNASSFEREWGELVRDCRLMALDRPSVHITSAVRCD